MVSNRSAWYLWSIDPGYFQLKQAVNTLVAVVLSLLILKNAPLMTMIIGGIASGLSLQGVTAVSFGSRLLHVLVFNTIYLLVFCLGLMVRNMPSLIAPSLVLLGFGVNYFRQSNLINSLIPLMVWLMFFLTLSLPIYPNIAFSCLFSGIGVGLSVSAIFILFFPSDYSWLFSMNSKQFFEVLSNGLSAIRGFLSNVDRAEGLRKLVSIRTTLRYFLETNQSIERRLCYLKENVDRNMILIHQYALLNAYSLMVDACELLSDAAYELSSEGVCLLDLFLHNASFICSSIDLKVDTSVSIAHAMCDLPLLTAKIRAMPLKERSSMKVLFLLQLSMSLFCKQLRFLIEKKYNA